MCVYPVFIYQSTCACNLLLTPNLRPFPLPPALILPPHILCSVLGGPEVLGDNEFSNAPSGACNLAPSDAAAAVAAAAAPPRSASAVAQDVEPSVAAAALVLASPAADRTRDSCDCLSGYEVDAPSPRIVICAPTAKGCSSSPGPRFPARDTSFGLEGFTKSGELRSGAMIFCIGFSLNSLYSSCTRSATHIGDILKTLPLCRLCARSLWSVREVQVQQCTKHAQAILQA